MYGSWWLCIISEALRNKCASEILSNLPRLGSGLCSYSCMLKSMLSTLNSWHDKQALQKKFPMGVANANIVFPSAGYAALIHHIKSYKFYIYDKFSIRKC
jgi:hypothetical protein